MILTGIARIGRDAELRSTTNGDQVAELSLAFNYGNKGQDGKRPSAWIRASLWGKRAESLVAYLVKGQQVSVVLEDPHVETYEKSNGGGTGYSLVARVSSIEFAGPPPDAARAPAPAPAPRAQQRSQAPAPAPRQQRAPTGFDDMDDDVQF